MAPDPADRRQATVPSHTMPVFACTYCRALLHRPELPRWFGQEVAIGVGVRVAIRRAYVAHFMGNGVSMIDTTNAPIGLRLP